MFKIIALVLMGLAFLFVMFLYAKNFMARKRPIPEEVNDVYDEERFQKWKNYSADQMKAKLIMKIIYFAIIFTLIITDVFALASAAITNIYLSTFVVLGIYVGVGLITDIVEDYIVKIKIDSKYGFNKATGKTFLGDCIRKTLLYVILFAGLTSLFIVIYEAMGDYILIAFSAFLFVFILLIKVLFPLLSKSANRFAPLEEGELRSKLMDMLTKHGFKVKDIKVMDASRRTTKSNAYFTGMGKNKTVVLYDNMLKTLSNDEIVAVFAHEIAHGIHKDSLRGSILSIVNIVLLVVLAWLLVRFPEFYTDFGFNGVNYGFAVVLLFEVVTPLIFRFLNMGNLALSRHGEYKADEFAAKEGYGEQLISGLKKLYKEDLGDINPDPMVIAMSYSHPTLAQRIKSIRKNQK